MDPFFMYVSIGALVLLILLLVVIGVGLTQLQALDSFPPTQSACPDYWDVSSNPAYCGIPVVSTIKNYGYIDYDTVTGVRDSNKANIGLCKGNAGVFGCSGNTSSTYLELKPKASAGDKFQYAKLNNNTKWDTMYPGVSERCAKKSWAQTMNITWDGVTNFNGC